MENYTSEITYSSRELTPIEKIKYKDLTATVSLDEELKNLPDNRLEFKLELAFNVHVNNPKAKGNTEYDTMVIVDADTGVRYRTSSTSFMNALGEIGRELIANSIDISTLTLVAYTRPSKNFTGKSFLTCAIA